MRYERVADERELLRALSEPGAAVLAGGTDLLVKLRSGLSAPDVVIDVTRMPSLSGIRRTKTAIEIGAAVPVSDVVVSPPVEEALPLLTVALRSLGSVQIRHRATLGGNLVNASPAADSAVPLLVYEAQLDLVGPEGERTVPLVAFLLGPGRTALADGEFVRTIRIPLPEPGLRTFYHKVGKRRALTIAIASLGGLVRLGEDGQVTQARFAAGSVAPTPVRLDAVERHLRGRALTEDAIADARRLAIEGVSPITDVRATAEYRSEVIGDLTARALRAVAGRPA